MPLPEARVSSNEQICQETTVVSGVVSRTFRKPVPDARVYEQRANMPGDNSSFGRR